MRATNVGVEGRGLRGRVEIRRLERRAVTTTNVAPTEWSRGGGAATRSCFRKDASEPVLPPVILLGGRGDEGVELGEDAPVAPRGLLEEVDRLADAAMRRAPRGDGREELAPQPPEPVRRPGDQGKQRRERVAERLGRAPRHEGAARDLVAVERPPQAARRDDLAAEHGAPGPAQAAHDPRPARRVDGERAPPGRRRRRTGRPRPQPRGRAVAEGPAPLGPAAQGPEEVRAGEGEARLTGRLLGVALGAGHGGLRATVEGVDEGVVAPRAHEGRIVVPGVGDAVQRPRVGHGPGGRRPLVSKGLAAALAHLIVRSS